MAAKAWTCKCGHLNDPADEGFSTSKCISCGKNKFVIYYITAIGLGGLILIIFLISILMSLPKKRYVEAFRRAYQDNSISPEEQKELNLIAKRYQISEEKVEAWSKEVIRKLGPRIIEPPEKKIEDRSLLAMDEPPLEAKQHMHNGLSHARQGDFDNAIIEFNLAIESYPKYAAAYGSRGEAYKQTRKYNKAEEDLKKAVKLDDKDKNAHYNLAGLYCIQGKFDLALDELDKALELGFNNYDILRTDPDFGKCRQDAKCRENLRKVLEEHKVFIMR